LQISTLWLWASRLTQAKHIEEMYDTIVPETVKAQIEKRDAPKQIEDGTKDKEPS